MKFLSVVFLFVASAVMAMPAEKTAAAAAPAASVNEAANNGAKVSPTAGVHILRSTNSSNRASTRRTMPPWQRR